MRNASMEYTLEDALATLKDKKAQQEKHIDNLTNVISNNQVYALTSSNSLEDVSTKQDKLRKNLLKEIQKVEPDYPIPRTSDLREEVMSEMEEEIRDMQKLLGNLEHKLLAIQEDITYLRNKKSGLEKMQEACQDITEVFANKTYENEFILTKRMFRQVKEDLYSVVNVLFPDNDGFKELLAELSVAYMKGGDDVYINVTADTMTYVHFLLEADIVQYHRNDKTRIRMIELL